MTYSLPDLVIVDRTQKAFPSNELREHTCATNLVQRERKFDIIVLFYILSFGSAVDSDRPLQAFLKHYIETADCDGLSYTSFHDWFEPGFVALLREVLDDTIENPDTRRKDLNSRLERSRNVLIAGTTIVSLYQDAADIYTATGGHQAELKLHLTEFLSAGLPARLRTTGGTTRERSQLSTGERVADTPILLDLGFYDFWLFGRIDQNGGWSVSRVKDDVNLEIIEELQT